MRAPISALELAAGFCLGRDEQRSRLLVDEQRAAAKVGPVDALERAVERILDRAPGKPVLVEFSGGLDSSLVLSAATRLLRRRGLPDPVPVTVRYDDPDSDERDYQELMIRHLGLDEWRTIEAATDLDLLSPDAQQDLLAHGLSGAARVPTGRWFYRQLDAPATLLSGEGGDEVFGPGPLAPIFFWLGAVKRRRFVRASTVIAARHLRGRMRPAHARLGIELPAWLTPTGEQAVANAFRSTYASHALTVRRAHRDYYSMRSNGTIQHDMQAQAAEFGIDYAEPLMDARFIAELTSTTPDRHFIDRNRFFRRHFSELLPPAITDRTTKAFFNQAVFSERTREFAESFDRFDCLPLEYVDPERVRAAWLSADDARSGLMLQHAWLASQGRS